MTRKWDDQDTDHNGSEVEAKDKPDPVMITRRGFTLSSVGGIAGLLLGSACGSGTEGEALPEGEDDLDERDGALSGAATDLTGYWTFDEGGGTVVTDWSGRRNDGEIIGATWVTDSGRPCLTFDGVPKRLVNGVLEDDTCEYDIPVVEIPHRSLNPGSPMTILISFKKMDASGELPSNGFLLQYWGNHKQKTVGFSLAAERLHFTCNDGKLNDRHLLLKPKDLVPNNTWVLAAVTISATQITLYKDGVEMNSLMIDDGFPATFGGSVLTVGAQDQTPTRYFRGRIGELAIFNRVLSADEISALNTRFSTDRRLSLATPYGGLAVGAVTPGKMLYRRGESGTVGVVVKNFGSAPVTTTPYLEGLSLVGTGRRLHTAKSRTFAAGEVAVLTMPFTFAPDVERFGVELRAVVSGYRGAHVAVSDNFWEVGLGANLSPAGLGAACPSTIARELRRTRAIFANWFDFHFWAPDDWGNLNPTEKGWRSGQSAYPMDKDRIKTLIDKAHAYGMKAVTYGKHNAGGPDGFERFRRRPEWFLLNGQTGQPMGAGYDTRWLDDWNDEAVRKAGWKGLNWYYLYPDFRQVAPLDWGINQLALSADEYKWDAVRYDGHYTAGNDELSTWNIRRLKETLGATKPEYRFGYNYCFIPRSGFTHEMREALAGGGMWLNEGMKYLGYENGKVYKGWLHYATNELTIVKRIQAAGGTYHPSWRYDDKEPPAKFLYLLIYGLIAGAHPALTSYQNIIGCDNWGHFMTARSGFLWHPGLKKVEDPTSQVAVSNGGALQWQPFVQELVVNGSRKLKIVHLVNPPPSDDIASASLPSNAVYGIDVSLTLEPGTSIVRAAVYKPDIPRDYGMGLTPLVKDGVATVKVNQITHWGFVVFELAGQFAVPATPPAYTEEPSANDVIAGRYANAGQLSNDPLLPPANVTLAPGESLWETDDPSQSINGPKIADPDAANGWAQHRRRGSTQEYMGRTWMGPFPAGRYKARVRVKVEDDNPLAPTQQTYIVRLASQLPEYKLFEPATVELKVHSPKTPAQKLIPDGAYHYYDLPEMKLTQTNFLSLGGAAQCQGLDAAGKPLYDRCALYVDHFIIEQVEQYTDAKLAAWNPVVKPTGLPTPNGAKPANVLTVRGMFWKPYDVEGTLPCTNTYALPATYEELYEYDAVVLCDVDLSNSSFDARKRLNDFVVDGGRLVILGGPYTLGSGAMVGTYLDEMSPFVIRGAGEIVRCEPPLLLGAVPGVPYSDSPGLMWFHSLTPKPTATIDAYAAHEPVAARHAHGSGLAVVFAGTMLGEEEGPVPFWECLSWRTLLKKLVLG